MEKEFEMVCERLIAYNKKNRLKRLTLELKKARDSSDEAKSKELLESLNKLISA